MSCFENRTFSVSLAEIRAFLGYLKLNMPTDVQACIKFDTMHICNLYQEYGALWNYICLNFRWKEKKLQKKPPNFSMWHFLCSLLRCTPTHSVCCCGLALPCLMFGANECLWRSFHKQTNNSDTEFMQAFLYTQSLPQRSALQTRRAHAHTTLFARQTKQRNTLHECRVCNLYISTYA